MAFNMGIGCCMVCLCFWPNCTRDVCILYEYVRVFVFVGLKSVFICVCVCVSWDAPSKSDPRRGVIHDSMNRALHKALSNIPTFLSALLCLFPMLPFSFHVFPAAFLTYCFLCLFCCFTLSNLHSSPSPSLMCGFTPLLPLSPAGLVWFYLHLFPMLSSLVSNIFYPDDALTSAFTFFFLGLLRRSISNHIHTIYI